MAGTFFDTSMGTRAAASMFTILSVDGSSLFIFMKAAKMRGMKEALLEPTSRPTMPLGDTTLAPGSRLNTQYGAFWYTPATMRTDAPAAPPATRLGMSMNPISARPDST
ncbi:hypothetical protein D3C72_1987750 [compost metagenome]